MNLNVYLALVLQVLILFGDISCEKISLRNKNVSNDLNKTSSPYVSNANISEEDVVDNRTKRALLSRLSPYAASSMSLHLLHTKLNIAESIRVYRRFYGFLSASKYDRDSSRINYAYSEPCSFHRDITRNTRTLKPKLTAYYCAINDCPYINASSHYISYPQRTRERLLSTLNELVCDLRQSRSCGLINCARHKLTLSGTHVLSGYTEVLLPLQRLIHCSQQEIMRYTNYGFRRRRRSHRG